MVEQNPQPTLALYSNATSGWMETPEPGRPSGEAQHRPSSPQPGPSHRPDWLPPSGLENQPDPSMFQQQSPMENRPYSPQPGPSGIDPVIQNTMDHQEAMTYAWGNANNSEIGAPHLGYDTGMEGPNSNRIYAPQDGMNAMLDDYNFACELDEHEADGLPCQQEHQQHCKPQQWLRLEPTFLQYELSITICKQVR